MQTSAITQCSSYRESRDYYAKNWVHTSFLQQNYAVFILYHNYQKLPKRLIFLKQKCLMSPHSGRKLPWKNHSKWTVARYWYCDHKNPWRRTSWEISTWIFSIWNNRWQPSYLTSRSQRSTTRVTSWSGDTDSNFDWCSSCLSLSVYSGSIATW